MNANIATDVIARTRRSARVLAVQSLGPAAALAGVAWALFQPYRLPILHPHGQGLWWLLVEPPLLVLLAGALFHFLVAPGLVADLEESGP